MFRVLLKEKLKIQLEITELETKYLDLKRKLMSTSISHESNSQVLNDDLKMLSDIADFYCSILEGYNDLSDELNNASVLVTNMEIELEQTIKGLEIEAFDFVVAKESDLKNFEDKENAECYNNSSDTEYSPRVFIHKSCIKPGSLFLI